MRCYKQQQETDVRDVLCPSCHTPYVERHSSRICVVASKTQTKIYTGCHSLERCYVLNSAFFAYLRMSATSRRWAYRVQRIPCSEANNGNAKRFLREVFRENNISLDSTIRTVTTSPANKQYKTAIVTFDTEDAASPKQIFNPTSATWRLSIPKAGPDLDSKEIDLEDESPESISIDDKFLGFTALSAPRPEDHKQE